MDDKIIFSEENKNTNFQTKNIEKKSFYKDFLNWFLVFLFAYAMQLLVMGPINSSSDMAGFAFVFGFLTAGVITVVIAVIYYLIHFIINKLRKK